MMSQVSTTAITSSAMPQAAPGANASVSRETLLSYLIQASKTMRRVELGVGIAGWLCVIVVVLLAAILIDHWLWPLNAFARFAVFGILVAWSVWWVPRRIIPLLFRPIHPEHAARRIESQHPEMKESLISWLQLSTTAEAPAPKGVLAVIGRFAVRNLGGQDSSNIVDSAKLIQLAALLFGFLLTGSVYLFVAPKSGVTSLNRMLMPWANIAPAARVRIVNVAPGDATITQGTSVALAVTLRGMHKGDGVFVRYDLSDGQRVGQRLKLNEELEGINYKLDFGKSFGGIHQPLQYWIEAGDATAGPFDLRVQVVPIVSVDRIDLQFPAYTKLKSKSIPQDGSIEAPEGTRVQLTAHANQAMAKSRIEFNPVINNGVFHSASEILELETKETQINGAWTLTLDKKNTNPTNSTYRIKATNSLGESNGDPVIYKIKVLGDLPPEVRLQSELPTTIDLPINGTQEIEMRAIDPDYGLISLAATAKRKNDNAIQENKNLFEVVTFESEVGTTGQIVRVFQLKPSDYDLKVGDQLEFRAIAIDNRCKVGTDIPEPNKSSSAPVLIRIVEEKKNEAADSNPPEKQKESDESKEDVQGKQDPKKNDSKSSKSGKAPADQKGKSNSKDDKSGKGNNDPKQSGNSNSQDQQQDDVNPNPKENQNPQNSSNEDANSKSKPNKDDKKDKNQKKQKDGGSGSGGGGAESDEQGESNGSGSEQSNGNQKQSSNSKGSKGSKSSSDSSSAGNETSNSDDSQVSQDGTETTESRSRTKSVGKTTPESNGTSRKDNSNDEEWEPPKDEGEAFERINELRKEQEKKTEQAEDKQGEGKQGEGKQGEDKQAEDKQGEGKQGEGKQGEGKQGEGKQGVGKQGEGKQGEGKQGEGKQGEGKQGEGKQGEGKQGEGKQGEGKQGEGKQGEGKQGEGKQGEGKQGEGKQGEGKQGEGKQGEGKQGEGKQGEGKQGEGKQGEGKQGEGKQGEGKQGEGKQGEGKQGEGKQGEGKQGEGKQGEGKQGEGKQGEGKQGEGKQGEGKQGEGKQGEGKQGEGKQGEGKQGEGKQGEGKQGEGKQGEGKQGEGKQGEGKQGEGKQGEGKQDEGKQDEGKQDEGKQDEGKQGEGKQGEGKQGEGKQGEGKQGEGDGESEGNGKGGKSPKGTKPSESKSGGTPSGPNESGGMGSGGSGKKTAKGNTETKPEVIDKEYADKVTDLALDYLRDQKDQPDPELLKRMKWSKQDMQKFLQRWTEAKEQAKTDPNKKRELDATLKSLGLSPSKSKERKVEDRDDDLKGLLEEGNRVRPPESLREKWEQFRRAAGKL